MYSVCVCMLEKMEVIEEEMKYLNKHCPERQDNLIKVVPESLVLVQDINTQETIAKFLLCQREIAPDKLNR